MCDVYFILNLNFNKKTKKIEKLIHYELFFITLLTFKFAFQNYKSTLFSTNLS